MLSAFLNCNFFDHYNCHHHPRFLTDFKIGRGGSQFDWIFFFFFFESMLPDFFANRDPILIFFLIRFNIVSDWYHINLVKFWWYDQWQNCGNLQFLWANNRNYNKKKILKKIKQSYNVHLNRANVLREFLYL